MSQPASAPTAEQLRSLPAHFAQDVPEEFIDQNGHMNITHYFSLGAWAPWQRLIELGMDDAYLTERRMSLFTVEHRIRYVGELRLGEPFSLRPAMVARTAKAVHGAAFVLDESRDRLACTMEIIWVHVSLDERRSMPIPDDLTAALDADIAAHPWVAEFATGLALR